MRKVTLYALLVLSLAVSVKYVNKGTEKKVVEASVLPGGDPPPTCPTRICKK